MSIRLILTSLLFVWNIVTFSLYAIDKRRAIKGKWRISEKTLLVSTALCGVHRCSDCSAYLPSQNTKALFSGNLVV